MSASIEKGVRSIHGSNKAETKSHSLGEKRAAFVLARLGCTNHSLSLLSNGTEDLIAAGLTLMRVIFFSLLSGAVLVAVCTAILFTIEETADRVKREITSFHRRWDICN